MIAVFKGLVSNRVFIDAETALAHLLLNDVYLHILALSATQSDKSSGSHYSGWHSERLRH